MRREMLRNGRSKWCVVIGFERLFSLSTFVTGEHWHDGNQERPTIVDYTYPS
jgi:hypothetical protein